jgi:hypothetical protein
MITEMEKTAYYWNSEDVTNCGGKDVNPVKVEDAIIFYPWLVKQLSFPVIGLDGPTAKK